MYVNKRAMLSNVYDICSVVGHLHVSHAQEQSVRIHQVECKRELNIEIVDIEVFTWGIDTVA